MFPQILLISFCLLFPAYFLYVQKNSRILISWLGIVIVLDVFNSQVYMNLSAILLFGIAALPYLWSLRQTLLSNPVFKIFMIYLIYLGGLGIYFGFINPWPDLSGLRTIKDQAMMRSVLHFGRTLCEFSAIFYLSLQLEKNRSETANQFFKSIFVSSIVLCLSALAEKLFVIDFYHYFTGGMPLLLSHRLRGFDYEPRGMSQNLAYSILLLPFVPFKKWKYLFLPVFLIFAYALTISFTGVAVLAVGTIAFLFFSLFLVPMETLLKLKTKFFVGIVSLIAFFIILYSFLPATSTGYVRERFNFLGAQDLPSKFEVFDAAAVNFLIQNPSNIVFGTGPGLIYLPASAYVLERDNYIYNNRIDALPHTGLILLLSNGGLIGFALFLFALKTGIRQNKQKDLLFLAGLVLTALFFIQMRYFFVFGLAVLTARNAVAPPKRV